MREEKNRSAFIADSTNKANDSIRENEHKEYEDSLKSYHNYTTELLAKYGLKVDSLTNTVKSFDTSISRKAPALNFCDDALLFGSIKNDTLYYKLQICSENAASKLKSCIAYVVTSTKRDAPAFDNLIFLKTFKAFDINNLPIAKDRSMMVEDYVNSENLREFKAIYVLLKGTYTDSRGKNPQPLNTFGSLNLENKETGFLEDVYGNKIRRFLSKKGFKIY